MAALENPERPLLAIVGGAKVSTKIDLLMNLVTKVNRLFVGGAMANTFLAARGVNVGKSLSEPDLLDTAREIMAAAEKAGCQLLLPQDVVVARELKAKAARRVAGLDEIARDEMILDLGSIPARWKRPALPPSACASASWWPWRAEVIRWPRSITQGLPAISVLSRRPAAPFSNGWKENPFPA